MIQVIEKLRSSKGIGFFISPMFGALWPEPLFFLRVFPDRCSPRPISRHSPGSCNP